jgi:hypothetical protein
VLFFPVISFAQKKTNKILMETVNPHNVEWSEGSILTTDEEELKGLVKYNSKTGILNYEYGNDSRSMTPRGVVAFEFYDAEKNRQRVFYSLEFEERFHFFELLFDFIDFAVISKTDPADVDFSKPNQNFNDGTTLITTPTNKVYASASQLETICFLNPSGEITPYITIENIDKEGFWMDHSKAKKRVVDKDLLAEYLGTDYDKVKVYIKENDLNVKRKDDLMKVFEYYASIK